MVANLRVRGTATRRQESVLDGLVLRLVSHWTLGDDYRDPTPADWAAAARQHLADSKALLSSGSWRNAYMQVGMAVEMALKARIMVTEGLNAWPSRDDRPEVYTHRLGPLIRVANLRDAIEHEMSSGTEVGLAWQVVKDFDINLRYPTSNTRARGV